MEIKLDDLVCPIATTESSAILLAHGSGGAHMHKLLDNIILPHLSQNKLTNTHDSAVVTINNNNLAFTTDSYVIDPLFFPGGDIGSLSVYGTVNDLAMAGAKPLYLSVAFILEEGFAITKLQQILQSINAAAKIAKVAIVTGDTKVVERGRGHGIYINTAGIGIIQQARTINPTMVQAGDAVLVSGDIGKHGIAIMATREGLEFDTTIQSDSAPVAAIVEELLLNNIEIHCLRDITRGGLATTLHEIAHSSNTHIKLNELAIPIEEEVNNACELLGLDILQVACEGRFVAFIAAKDAKRALNIIQSCPHGKAASIIGETVKTRDFMGVTMTNCLGVTRVVEQLTGEQLPRIC